jgi:hypothetical protein
MIAIFCGDKTVMEMVPHDCKLNPRIGKKLISGGNCF